MNLLPPRTINAASWDKPVFPADVSSSRFLTNTRHPALAGTAARSNRNYADLKVSPFGKPTAEAARRISSSRRVGYRTDDELDVFACGRNAFVVIYCADCG